MSTDKAISRKEFLGSMVKGASLFAVPSILKYCMTGNTDGGISMIEGNFTNALPIPNVINAAQAGGVSLTAKDNVAQLILGKKTNVFGFGSGILGPTLTANKNDLVTINYKNELFEESNIHWHGNIIPQHMDGLPMNIVAPQDSFQYQYTISQRAGASWYHPHPHGKTAGQVAKGLAGMFLIRDSEENSLNLPSATNEIPLVIQDKRFSPDYSLDYGPSAMEKMQGYFGDHILVNGQFSNYISVANRWYRFRILNGSTARAYNLKFSNGMSFSVIGSDGGLLASPVSVTSVLLAPGERLDVLVDLSGQTVGSSIYLQSDQFSEGGGSQGNSLFKILKLNIDRSEVDSFTLPATLSTIAAIDTSSVVKRRTFRLSHGMGGFTINGNSYDMARVDVKPQALTTEIWTFDNSNSNILHPMHIHAVQFRILSRTGGRNAVQSFEDGYKDTVLVGVNEKVEVLVTFPSHKGVFVFHCHNLEHEDQGMMSNFEIV